MNLRLGAALCAAIVLAGAEKRRPLDVNDAWVCPILDGKIGENLAVRFYPEKAIAEERAGSASLNCAVLANGRFSDCAVQRETPAEFGFGEAALRIANFLIAPPEQSPSERQTLTIQFGFGEAPCPEAVPFRDAAPTAR